MRRLLILPLLLVALLLPSMPAGANECPYCPIDPFPLGVCLRSRYLSKPICVLYDPFGEDGPQVSGI